MGALLHAPLIIKPDKVAELVVEGLLSTGLPCLVNRPGVAGAVL